MEVIVDSLEMLYADDLMMTAKCEHALRQKLPRLNSASEAKGFKANVNITKRCNDALSVCGHINDASPIKSGLANIQNF